MPEYTLPPGEKGVLGIERQAANVVNDENVKLMQQVVMNGANEIVTVCGMEYYEAMTCILMALGSFLRDKMFNPSLVIVGGSTTGKSQAEKIAARYAMAAVSIVCQGLTLATVRDMILEQIKEPYLRRTIALEEADQIKDDPDGLTSFIASSYSKDTSYGRVNRGHTVGDKINKDLWTPEEYNLQGIFFINHRRTPVREIAKRRRTIAVHTYKKLREGGYPHAAEIDSPYAKYAGGVLELTLPPVTMPRGIEGASFDNWKVYLQIATAIGFSDYSEWANKRMIKETGLLEGDRKSEVSSVLVSCIRAEMPAKKKVGAVGYFSIQLREIRENARYYHGVDIRITDIRNMLTELGFKVGDPGGYPSVTPSNKSLEEAVKKLGMNMSDFEVD